MPQIRDRLRALTLPEALAQCERLGLPFAPIQRPEDLIDDPHLVASEGLAKIVTPNGAPAVAPKPPFTLDDWRPGVWRDIPGPGEQTREIARLGGLGDKEIDVLVEAGVLGAQMEPR